jgi:DNA-binding NtrC family response regulator
MKTIICIDDERIVLDSLKDQLKRTFGKEYAYEFAISAEDALEILQELMEDGKSIAFIVSDWLMPGMKGDEFFIKVHEIDPKIPKILLTGQADENSIETVKNKANLFGLFSKPWEETPFIQLLKSAAKS